MPITRRTLALFTLVSSFAFVFAASTLFPQSLVEMERMATKEGAAVGLGFPANEPVGAASAACGTSTRATTAVSRGKDRSIFAAGFAMRRAGASKM